MLAHTHAMTGAVAWLIAAPFVGADTPLELAGGTGMAAGAALLPDLDHHRGTASSAWGPLTRMFGKLVGWVCGGHRKGTHTLAAVIIVAALVKAALYLTVPALVVVVASLAGLAFIAWEDVIPGRWERLWPVNLAVSAGFAWWAVASLDLSWLPAAVAIGWLAHLAGDLVTDGGVPLFAPATGYRFKLTKLNTGGTWETAVAFVLVAAIGALSLATVAAWPQPWHTFTVDRTEYAVNGMAELQGRDPADP